VLDPVQKNNAQPDPVGALDQLKKKRNPVTIFTMNTNYRLNNWLANISDAILKKESHHKPSTETPILIIKRPFRNSEPMIIESMICRKLIKGGLGIPKKFTPKMSDREHMSDKLSAAYALLYFFNIQRYSNHIIHLEDTNIIAVLTPFLDANMVYWENHHTPLHIGPNIPLTLSWHTEEDGRQYLRGNDSLHVFKSNPMTYVDPSTQTIGLLESTLPNRIVELLRNAPGISASETQVVAETMAKIENMPIPETFTKEIERKLRPTPCLTLMTYTTHKSYSRDLVQYCGEISFQYDNMNVYPPDLTDPIENLRKGVLEKIPRHGKAEKSAFHFFKELNIPVVHKHPPSGSARIAAILGDNTNHARAVDDIYALIPKLRSEGWQVIFAPDFPIPDIIDVEEWYSELKESSDENWFGMALGVVVDGQKISLLEPLLAILGQKNIRQLLDHADNPEHRTLIPIGDKTLSFPTNRLHAVLHLIAELHRKKEGVFQIAKSRAGLLIEMEKAFSATQMRWLGDTQIVELGQKLQALSWPKISLPTSFHATLRPYQEEGVRWLQFLREQQLGGILADDMGLGKTIQTLAHIMIEKENGRLKNPCLIIAPTSVISNWKEEAQRFAPTLRILVLHGLNRHTSFEDISSHDLILSTYPLLIRDAKVLLSHRFSMIVLDEAHTIKNAQAKMTQIALQLKADSRICLTGTPMENHLGELWSLFHFLMPGFLGHKQYFQSNYRTPIEKQKNPEARDYLSQKLKPFILRRNKSAVAQDLPEKTEIQRHIVFEDAQRDLYESIRLSMHQKVKDAISEQGIERSQIMILDALLKLRQVCCDPRLVKVKKTNTDIPSAKLQHLLEMLPTLLEEGRRILLFSQFTSMFTLIEPELTKLKIPYLKLTGETQNRGELVTQFQEGNTPLFLISLKAGGTGLNLTAADTVIHYDPWWNPAVEAQATDRVHRIGQTSAVFVYKLITEGTVEEKILEMQHKKRNLVDSILSGGAMHSLMTMDDVEALFRG